MYYLQSNTKTFFVWLAGLLGRGIPWIHKEILEKFVISKVVSCNLNFFFVHELSVMCKRPEKAEQNSKYQPEQERREKVITSANHRSHYSDPTQPAASQCYLLRDVSLHLKYQCLESSYFKGNSISLTRLDIPAFIISTATTAWPKEKANSYEHLKLIPHLSVFMVKYINRKNIRG